MKKYSMIVAVDDKYGIAKEGKIPFHFKDDMLFFKKQTMNHVVIMGRKTWDSLPLKPLSNRINIILTLQNIENQDASIVYKNSIEDAFQYAESMFPEKKIFIIGGATIYDAMVQQYPELIENIYITHINEDYNCDQFFPKISMSKCRICRLIQANNDFSIVEYILCNNKSCDYYEKS